MNNFAISSGGIGEALERSASSLMAANNTIDESIALITAANTVVQDPTAVGTAFKTISMRIRGAKTELEEAGLETEGMVESTSTLRAEIEALAGVDIMEADGKTFKSTYAILDELAKKWNDLSDIQQATVTELIAGKRQGNIVSSLMANFDTARNALQTSLDSSGSAMEEHGKWSESLEAKLNSLSASWQGLSQAFLNSDFLKVGTGLLTELLDVLTKLIDSLGTLGTIGLGTSIYAMFKNKGLFSSILGDLSAFGSLSAEAWTSGGKLTKRFGEIGKAAKQAGGSIASRFTSSLSATVGAIGIAVAVIGLAINAYKNYREEISKARQETIEASNDFLESANSFEKAYIKYSGKTDLTVEEEKELETAINGTVDALGDKSSALQNVVNSSNDYVASLERITDAELKAAANAAKEKKENAGLELQDKVKGWGSIDGSEVDVELGRSRTENLLETNEAIKIAKDIGKKYYKLDTYGKDNDGDIYSLVINPDASADEILDYYHTLEKIKDAYIDNDLIDTSEYEKVSATIENMSEIVKVYEDSLYDLAIAQYKAREGIPKTTEEYLKMRRAILEDMRDSGAALDTKVSILNALESQYGQIFDLSSVEAQAKKFIGVVKGWGTGTKDGTNEIGTIETFLNMRTAVNNNDVPIGEYIAQFKEIDNLASKAGWSKEEKKLVYTSFGIDTDSIKAQYDEMYEYLFAKSDVAKRHEEEQKLAQTEGLDLVSGADIGGAGKIDRNISKFLNSLTAKELAAVIDIRTEIDWENTSAKDIRKQIEDQVKLNEAMSFTIPIDIETEGIEALNTALAESKSATGLTAESIKALKARYEDLDGYNVATLFEETANGIRVNSTELAKLEEEYKDFNKQEADETLKVLKKEYDKLTDEINNCTGDQKKLNDLYEKRDAILDQINDVATLATQYKGLTSAYNEWQKAQEAGQDRDMYESILEGREEIEDEMSRGWLDDATIEYLELLTGKELSTAGVNAQIEAYKELNKTIGDSGYSIWDFFTKDEDGNATSDGVFNFFDTVKSVAGETAAWIDENGKYHFNFEGFEHNGKTGDAAIADILGTSEELVQIILKAAEDAGFVVNIKGEYSDLADAADDIHNLNEQLKKVGATTYTFNVNATDLNYINEQIGEAKSALKYFEERDGKINLDDSDVEAAARILNTLIFRKSDLENPTLMSIDVSEPTTKLEEVLGLAQQLKDAKANLEIKTAIGADTTEAEAEIDSLLSQLSSKGYTDIIAGLSIDTSSVDSAIASINNISADKMITLGLDTSKIDGYKATEQEAKGTVTWDNDDAKINQWIAQPHEATGTVNWTNNDVNVQKSFTASGTVNWTSGNKVKVDVVSKANGTANANGTASGRAFKQGNWGIKDSGTALVGELGMETLVRDGRFYTIGDNGAEFIKYKQGDIIFNHKQTEELFANGKVTSGGGRGKALAEGTAFAIGSGGLGFGRNAISQVIKVDGGGGKTSTKTETKTKKNESGITVTNTTKVGTNGSGGTKEQISDVVADKDKFEETFDWISIAIERIEREIDNLDKTVNNTYKSWGDRNKALTNEIVKVGEEIALQNNAATEYLAEANAVGLDESYAEKVRNGTLDINTITDEDTAEKIKEYEKWYNLYLACIDAAEDLKQTESELWAQRFDDVVSEYDGILQGFEHTETMLNEYISQAEAKGHIVSKNYYQALIDNEKSNIAELQKEQADLIAKRDEAVASGAIVKGSQAWYNMCAEIDGVTQAIEEGTTSLIEYGNAMRDIDWQVFDLIQEQISDVAEEANFLIDLMSYDKLFDDNGKLTDKGMATMGLHGQNYNTYMYAADEYGKEITKLDTQIANGELDGKSLDVINRRRELIELQRESILAAEDEKQAIKDLVEEGINLELEALQERIDLHNEELDSMKDLYDYQKNVEEQTKNIASLQKQLHAYEGFDDEETRATIQKLKVELESAQQDLQETEFDRYLSQQEELLSSLYEEYELTLNTRLDDVDGLVSQVVVGINDAFGAEGTITSALGAEGAIASALAANATSIGATLKTEAEAVGTTLSTAMDNIWKADGSGKAVLDLYGKDFQSKHTTTNDALNSIKSNVAAMVDDIDKESETKIDEPKTNTSANEDPVKNNGNQPKKEEPKKDNKPEITDDTLMGIASAIWVYGKKSGWGNNPFRENKLTNKIGALNAKKVQDYVNKYGASGKLYNFWLKKGMNLKKYYYNAFATGAKNIDEAQFAWTQEKGQEFIVRPSDGAILTPIAKGDSVLNAQASGNIWNMANNPAEFIKDSLKLDATNTPNSSNVQSSCVQNFENVVFNMPNVRNYEQLLSEMQKDKNFERLIMSMTIDQIAGKSSLAKNKSIR